VELPEGNGAELFGSFGAGGGSGMRQCFEDVQVQRPHGESVEVTVHVDLAQLGDGLAAGPVTEASITVSCRSLIETQGTDGTGPAIRRRWSGPMVAPITAWHGHRSGSR